MSHAGRFKKRKRDFELDLLKIYQDDGWGKDCFDEIGILIAMRMRGYFQDARDDETIDELIERYEY